MVGGPGGSFLLLLLLVWGELRSSLIATPREMENEMKNNHRFFAGSTLGKRVGEMKIRSQNFIAGNCGRYQLLTSLFFPLKIGKNERKYCEVYSLMHLRGIHITVKGCTFLVVQDSGGLWAW